MSSEIRVGRMDSATCIIAAFQQALDAVFSREAIREILADPHSNQRYKQVYGLPGQPAIGSASIVLGRRRQDSTSVFLTIYASGYHEQPVRYVPASLARRLFMRLRGSQLVEAPVQYHGSANEYLAQLQGPSAVFRSHPRVMVELRR